MLGSGSVLSHVPALSARTCIIRACIEGLASDDASQNLATRGNGGFWF